LLLEPEVGVLILNARRRKVMLLTLLTFAALC